MKPRISFPANVVWILFGCLILATIPSPAPGQTESGGNRWLLPNFAQRLELDVSNPTDAEVYALAVVDVNEASQVALRFPGSLAIAVMPNDSKEPHPYAVIPSQADDLDGDGQPEEFVFPVTLKGRETRTVHVYYSTTLRDRMVYPKKVHAQHNFGYNRQAVALESEIVGYRFYGFFTDVQGRAAGFPGLYNNFVGYFGSGHPSIVGRDVVHIGDTLGLGGLFVRRDKQMFRPAMNVPDYTHKPSPPDVPRYRVIADGPVRAVVEARIDRWKAGDGEIRLQALYSIGADMAHLDCRVDLYPLRIAGNRPYEIGVGVRHLPEGQRIENAPGRLLVCGTEDPKAGRLGLAMFFDPKDVDRSETVASQEAGNEAVILARKLKGGEAVTFQYSVAGCWAGGGIDDLAGYLKKVEAKSRMKVRISNMRISKTPNPERVEGEA